MRAGGPSTTGAFLPLRGTRVIEFCANIAGPYATMILAQLGADVIKVEPPEGDDARGFASRLEGESIVFRHFGAGKRGVVIDVKRPEGLKVALDLVATCDVLIESMRPGSAQRLGIGEEVVRARAPEILYYDVNAYGTGPLGRQLPGYDPLLQAFSGIMEMTGHDDTPPTRCAPSVVDLSTGQWVAMGVLAALLHRQRGDHVNTMETALIDVAFNLIPYQATAAKVTGVRPPRSGSGNPIASPYQCYRASDGYLMIAAANNRLWQGVVRALNAPWLLDDRRFVDVATRSANRRELEVALNDLLSTHEVTYWIEQFEKEKVPAGRVLGLEESVVNEITTERSTFLESGPAPLVRLPWMVDESSVPWQRAAPKLGQDTREVLVEIGYGEATIAQLVDEGVLRV